MRWLMRLFRRRLTRMDVARMDHRELVARWPEVKAVLARDDRRHV